MPNPTGYSRLQIRLHWIITILIVAQFVFNESIVGAWDMFIKTGTTEFSPLVAAHVFGGIAILLLVLWRLAVRFKRGAPLPPESEHPLLKMAAHISHWLLYALMILMPVSGVLAWFGGIEQAATNHFYMKFAILGLVALHVVAALFHQFVLKTNLIQRMKTPEA